MPKINISVLIFVVLLVVLITGLTLWVWPGFLIKSRQQTNNNQPEASSSLGDSSTSADVDSNKDNPPVKPSAPSSNTALTYTQAINVYANRRIQFDVNCAVIPNNLVFKKGTQVMLDNRSNQKRAVFFDGNQYNLEPYGFKIITLSTSLPLPHTVRIDCGSGKNNGQLILQ